MFPTHSAGTGNGITVSEQTHKQLAAQRPPTVPSLVPTEPRRASAAELGVAVADVAEEAAGAAVTAVVKDRLQPPEPRPRKWRRIAVKADNPLLRPKSCKPPLPLPPAVQRLKFR